MLEAAELLVLYLYLRYDSEPLDALSVCYGWIKRVRFEVEQGRQQMLKERKV